MLTIFVHENGEMSAPYYERHGLTQDQLAFFTRKYGPIVARWTIKLKTNEVL